MLNIFKDKDKKDKLDKEKDKGDPKSIKSPRGEPELPPRPDDARLNQMFERLMTDLNIPKDQIQVMRAFPPERKWTLICQNNKNVSTASTDNPSHFIKMLSGRDLTLKNVESLRIILGSQPLSWVTGFLELKGINLIYERLIELQKKENKTQDDMEIITEFIRCLKALMNDKSGLDACLNFPESIETLAKSLDFVSERMQVQVLELLAALCLVSNDVQQRVLGIFKKNLPNDPAKNRFGQLTDFIMSENIPLKVAGMTLINAVIRGSAEKDERVEIRALTGMDGIIVDLSRQANRKKITALQTQIDIYEEGVEDDKVDEPEPPKEDPTVLFNTLRDQVRGKPVYDYLIYILQHLLLVRKDQKTGLLSWMLIDKFIQKCAIVSEVVEPLELTKMKCQELEKEVEKTAGYIKNILVKSEIAWNKKRNAPPAPEPEAVPAEGAPPPPPPPGMGGMPPPPPPPPGGGGMPPPPPPPPGMGGPPPPPPPPGMGGPPPPPPPPGMGGPPPPPGMGMMAAVQPRKPEIKPGKKLKLFNWTKIPDREIDNTIWKNLDDADILKKLNKKEFEEFFNAEAPKVEDAPPPEELQTAKPKIIQLLDTKRSNNISIMLSRFKDVSHADIKNAVLNLNEYVLNGENVMALRQFVPLPEEVEILKSFSGNKENLGVAEKFMLQMIMVPKLEVRLDCMIAKSSFESKITAVTASVDIISSTIDEIKDSKKFMKLLEILLALGNYLNGGTNRGRASGFKLDTLLKVADVKTANNKGTLMDFIVDLCEATYPDLVTLIDDFPDLEFATRESFTQTQIDFNSLRKGLAVIQKELETNTDPTFEAKFKGFHQQATTEFTKIESRLKNTEERYKKLVQSFAADPKLDTSDFFAMLFSFVNYFEKICKDHAKKRAAAEREKEKALVAERRKADRDAKKNVQQAQRSVIDDLIENMRYGDAFAAPKKKPVQQWEANLFGDDEEEKKDEKENIFMGKAGLKKAAPAAKPPPAQAAATTVEFPKLKKVEAGSKPGTETQTKLEIPSLRPTTGRLDAPAPFGPKSPTPSSSTTSTSNPSSSTTTPRTPSSSSSAVVSTSSTSSSTHHHHHHEKKDKEKDKKSKKEKDEK